MLSSSDYFPLFQQGVEQAFRQVFDNYYSSVCYFAAKILNDDIEAEDIASDTFRKAWDNRAKFASPRHLENFLYLVTRNACINKLRHDRVVGNTAEEWMRLASDGIEADVPLDIERIQAHLVEAVLEKLKTLKGGDVLRMSYIEGKSTPEIAEELNITENNVYLLKSRGLKELRSILSNTEWMLFVLIFLHW